MVSEIPWFFENRNRKKIMLAKETISRKPLLLLAKPLLLSLKPGPNPYINQKTGHELEPKSKEVQLTLGIKISPMSSYPFQKRKPKRQEPVI